MRTVLLVIFVLCISTSNLGICFFGTVCLGIAAYLPDKKRRQHGRY